MGSPDIDNDGVEDLVLVHGFGANAVDANVWYGGSIPTGVVDETSASYQIDLPGDFVRAWRLYWVGDLNDDGLNDLVVTDDEQRESTSGEFEVWY